jgi:lysophospholipase L1-like esterase
VYDDRPHEEIGEAWMARRLLTSILVLPMMVCSGYAVAGDKTRLSKPLLIEVYGDSTAAGCTPVHGAPAVQPCHTAGYAVADPSPEATLQSLLRAKYGSSVTVENRGVAGNTIPALLSGDSVNLPWVRQMAQSKAQIVSLNFGINDSKVAAKEPVDVFRRNLSDLIRIAKATGKIVVVETASPVNDPLFAALPTYVAASIAEATNSGVPVIDQYGYLHSRPTWNAMLADSVHPTQAGYNLRAKVEFEVFDRIVGDVGKLTP